MFVQELFLPIERLPYTQRHRTPSYYWLLVFSATSSNPSDFRYANSMKLGFEESQSPFSSGSQKARAWTEAWVRAWAYCPHCGNARISSFPNNSPLADFFCGSCSEEFELKSQKGKFGTRVVDGAFKTKCERLAASNNPNLFLMNYDLKSLAVVNLFIVPKHFFVREIIEERKPLAVTARRAGWIGSNILLSRVPEFGQDSYRAERNHPRKGLGSRRMAENAFPSRRIAGIVGLAARRHEMRGVARQA